VYDFMTLRGTHMYLHLLGVYTTTVADSYSGHLLHKLAGATRGLPLSDTCQNRHISY
jgi:hypothetical protein